MGLHNGLVDIIVDYKKLTYTRPRMLLSNLIEVHVWQRFCPTFLSMFASGAR